MRSVFSGLVLVLLTMILMGCPGSEKKDSDPASVAQASQKRTSIPVEAQLPTRGAVSEYFETDSRVEAERKVTATSQGMGTCLKVFVDEGDRVSAGDVLAELDKEELNAQLRSANAQLQKLQSDYGRSKQLYEEGLAAKAEYDNARYSYEQQLAAVNQQQVQLDNMTIRAPISGVVTVKHIQQGDLVSSGAPAFDLVDPNSYILTINPPEQILPRVKVGQTARVSVDAVEGGEFEAKVRRINPSVDPTTGTVKVILDFAKDEMARLRESAFARIRLVMDTRDDALLVPKDAVIEENARKYLFIIEPLPEATPEDVETGNSGVETMIATRVEVRTGLEDNAKVEILEGIDALSPIVTVGQQTLKTGSEVKLTTAQDELLAKAGLSADEALKAAEAERARGAKTVDRRTGM
jgi:membrane fusion protein (multidrug efflux system)